MGIHMKNILSVSYQDIISIKNLHQAWEEFLPGKKNKPGVAEFALHLSQNIFELHQDLKSKTYTHSPYQAFNVSDPKPRNIHKASVRDRLLHHAIYRVLYPYFDKLFIFDSYSCRLDKGTHRALNRFRDFGRKVSKNNTKTCWVLKCDIRKFFASIDHLILLQILKKKITDENVIWLLSKIITSFHSTQANVGLPLGNLTSQLLVNIYMNQFDHFMKHRLKVKYYIRYADDFVILSQDKDYLLEMTAKIGDFLEESLKLNLHPNKVFIKTFASGVDFLGWIHFSQHRVLRTGTRRRVVRALQESENVNVLSSYVGLLKHGSEFELRREVEGRVEILTSTLVTGMGD
ncbi:MAG: group II intron reverse transcriptase domain-containing protein [Phycisphaeraceae bacterium]|nr:group II intron reverse transcriptase domain-containing protein [Phycisphaeraceae bacterium]